MIFYISKFNPLLILTIISTIIYNETTAQSSTFKEKLERNDTHIKLLSIGSSLSSGVRNDGLKQEYQLSSFPSLLSAQLKAGTFKSPAFNDSPTLKISTDPLGIPKYEYIQPGSTTERDKTQFSDRIDEINNFSIPFLKILNLRTVTSKYLENHLEKKSFTYLSHLQSANSTFEAESPLSMFEKKIEEDFDFFIYELGFDDFISYMKSGGYINSIDYIYNPERLTEMNLIKKLSAKSGGVILNLPDPKDLPYFKIFSTNRLNEIGVEEDFFIEDVNGAVIRPLKPSDLILYSNESYRVISENTSIVGKSLSAPFYDSIILSENELSMVNVKPYNDRLKFLGEKHNIPVVDLNSLFKKINQGEFYSIDGLKVNPDYPTGNFYSGDGIFPSELGHRIICNEIIDTINRYYGTTIEYLKLNN